MRRAMAVQGNQSQMQPENEFDPYSLPEWQRTEAASQMLGHAPLDQSMDMVAKDNPNWYDLPDWMRTDALSMSGFGSGQKPMKSSAASGESSIDPEEARKKNMQAMFYQQSQK
jgi:hypothetical protein